MKIRTDFITNSSSSTFYVEKGTQLYFVDSSRSYSFMILKVNDHISETSSPKEFGKYVNYHYLLKGTKPKINRMMDKAGLNDFAKFLIQEKKEKGDFYIVTAEREYSIGYGESIGNDIDRVQKLIYSHLHPSILEYFKDRNLCAETRAEGPLGLVDWIEMNKIVGDPDGDRYYFSFIRSREYVTDEFYRFLYRKAGKPDLDFSLMEEILKRQKLDEEMLEKIKTRSPRIIYFAKDTKQNDVVAYVTKLGKVVVEDYSEYIKQL